MALSKYIIIPGEDYQNICNSVRAKTGKTDKLKSGEVANEILNIQTGGGGSEGGPYIVQRWTKITNSNKVNVEQRITLMVRKGAIIIAVYSAFTRMMLSYNGQVFDEGTYAPMIGDFKMRMPGEYTTEENLDGNTVIAWIEPPGSLAGEGQNIFGLMAQIAIPGITVKPRNDGFYDAVLTDPNDPALANIAQGTKFLGINTSQHFKTFSVAGENVSLPSYVCADQLFLESVDLTGVVKLNKNCFNGCLSLSGTLNIPEGVTDIPISCFQDTKLEKIVFPASLTTIGYYAFQTGLNVKNPPLKEFDFSACTVVPTITSNSFDAASKIQAIKVPAALFDAWSSAQYWSNYAAKIVAV